MASNMEIVQKLMGRLIHKKSQVTQWPKKFCVIQPAQPLIPPELSHEILEVVHEALLYEKQLQVTYLATNRADAKQKEYRLHPQGLIQRGPVTYLAAMTNLISKNLPPIAAKPRAVGRCPPQPPAGARARF